MSQPLNLVAFFAQALKSYQLSNVSFRVLCSLPSSAPEPAPLPTQQRPPTSLLILDSSFNPPTIAHQRMALSAIAEPHYASNSRVLLLLAINNADKAPKPAAFPQRLAMMYIFARDLLRATVDSLNVGGEGIGIDIAVTTEPYFHSKSRAIAECNFYKDTNSKMAAKPGTNMKQVYLTGFDTLIRIFNPKYYPHNTMALALDPFFANSSLRVTMRTDDEWGDASEQRRYLEDLKNGKLHHLGGKTEWADMVEMAGGLEAGEVVISSTKVREAVRNRDWDALGKLVSEGVKEWIRHERLYAADDG
jgi:nicotinamide-nucleotide adenylyltransferase